MEWFIFILVGAFAGVAGGMGMGGGTLLIPLLTIYIGVPQLEAQMINLIAFIPMAAVSLVILFKNKLVDLKKIWYVLPSAIVFAIIGAFLSGNIEKDILRRVFGSFLILLSLVFLMRLLINKMIEHINYRAKSSLGQKITFYIHLFARSLN